MTAKKSKTFDDWAKETTEKPTKNETVKYYKHCIPIIIRFLEMRANGESTRPFNELLEYLKDKENVNPPYKLSLAALKAYMTEHQPELFMKARRGK